METNEKSTATKQGRGTAAWSPSVDGALENRNDGEMRSIYIDAAGNESGRETESGTRTAKKQSPRFSFKK